MDLVLGYGIKYQHKKNKNVDPDDAFNDIESVLKKEKKIPCGNNQK